MTNQIQHNGRTKIRNSDRDERLSPDGLWRSYPKVPNLLCYVKSGTYYGRLKVNGKIIRRSLHQEGETEMSFTTAKLRLADFIKKERTVKKAVVGTFAEARACYEADLAADHAINDKSRKYREYCIRLLLKSWPGLDDMRLEKITVTDCKVWAAKLSSEIHQTYFNNVLGTLRGILKRGGLTDNPANEIKRLGVKKTDLRLPEPEQFEKIIKLMESAGGGESKHCADYARFLAFSGCRISEAQQVAWLDVDFERGLIRVNNAKKRLAQNGDDARQVPIIADMLALLNRLKEERNPQPGDKVCLVATCEASLTRACKLANASRITHHDLRHLFATRCIESGVDIPTVSRWLGHSDGGALAMRVYGHLRASHSVEMAKRVSFAVQKEAA